LIIEKKYLLKSKRAVLINSNEFNAAVGCQKPICTEMGDDKDLLLRNLDDKIKKLQEELNTTNHKFKA
jgi:hypothetical protein